jgi:thioredoxin reductase
VAAQDKQSIVIVGDGPGGLSAALFLAKARHQVRVYGRDETVMHYALLRNYLGIEETAGEEFQEFARQQVTDMGAELLDVAVTAVAATPDGFTVTTADETVTADYLVLSEGKKAPLAESLGLDRTDDGGIVVDRNGRTSMPRVYVVGRSVRPKRSQAIISAGDGAAAALDILSDIAGKDIEDWDS